jgi:hypothetical protein
LGCGGLMLAELTLTCVSGASLFEARAVLRPSATGFDTARRYPRHVVRCHCAVSAVSTVRTCGPATENGRSVGADQRAADTKCWTNTEQRGNDPTPSQAFLIRRWAPPSPTSGRRESKSPRPRGIARGSLTRLGLLPKSERGSWVGGPQCRMRETFDEVSYCWGARGRHRALSKVSLFRLRPLLP